VCRDSGFEFNFWRFRFRVPETVSGARRAVHRHQIHSRPHHPQPRPGWVRETAGACQTSQTRPPQAPGGKGGGGRDTAPPWITIGPVGSDICGPPVSSPSKIAHRHLRWGRDGTRPSQTGQTRQGKDLAIRVVLVLILVVPIRAGFVDPRV